MKTSHATLSFFAVLALAGCAGTLQVRTDYDPEVSLTQLSTYDWVDQEADASGDPVIDSPLLKRHIRDAVEGELDRMGYRKATSGTPDFRIAYRVTAEEKSRIDGSYGFGSYGFGSYRFGGPYWYPRSYNRGYLGFSLYGGRYLRPYNGYYGYPSVGYGYAGTGRVREYLRGTLVLDIIDVRTDEVVFRGSARKSLDLDPDPEKLRMYVSEAVEKILEDFPPLG
ncbi:MAG: DUF4136 domain-containing protein [Gemmatimonadetes bacterium]|nr:DUF4136 domain-containing protein [Gemmatimonadota bacterium]